MRLLDDEAITRQLLPWQEQTVSADAEHQQQYTVRALFPAFTSECLPKIAHDCNDVAINTGENTKHSLGSSRSPICWEASATYGVHNAILESVSQMPKHEPSVATSKCKVRTMQCGATKILCKDQDDHQLLNNFGF